MLLQISRLPSGKYVVRRGDKIIATEVSMRQVAALLKG